MNRIALFAAIMCAASAGFARDDRVDFDHGIHFSCYKTYSWAQPANASSSGTVFPNQLMHERISAFIDEALAAKGLKRVATGGDLLVSYNINVTEQPYYTTFADPGPGWGWAGTWALGWGTGWGGQFATTMVQTFLEGTLVVDMVQANQNQLVFQGVSTHSISSKPAKNTRKMRKAVNEIFEKYPPRL